MKRELDEIEMGKERTLSNWIHALRAGDRVRTIDGKVGNITCVMRATDEATRRAWFDVYDVDGTGGSYFGWQLEPIPVEPERVKARWCRYYGRCVLMTGDWCEGLGENTCGAYVTLPPSPGLLQRMGMATWESDDDWFVVFDCGDHLEETKEHAILRAKTSAFPARAFKWSDGVQG
jgi:hypothetical protein